MKNHGLMEECQNIFGLILDHFGRDDGLRKLYSIISELHKLALELYTVRISQILKLEHSVQRKLYNYINKVISKETLSPLTVILTSSKASIFAECFYCPELSVEDRCSVLTETMRKIMDHQSNEATDIRFVALYFNLLSGKLHLLKDQIDLLAIYSTTEHTEEIMRTVRPTVRSLEMMILQFKDTNSIYLVHGIPGRN